MSVDYPVWTGEEWVEVQVPSMGGAGLVVPNVAAVVYSVDRASMLLQRRDKPGEVVRGRLEIPGGRWNAGESAEAAVTREVFEETGVSVTEMLSGFAKYDFPAGLSLEASRPAAVIAGLHGAYPAVLVTFECIGEGVPRPLVGESAAPAWWSLSDVRDHLNTDQDDFVWQTAAILRELLGVEPADS
ncbi:MAG: NUDIX domain-containing protein [bacterium]|nr:NUDIX domain-containing protein [bacterium]